jgi:hypothetical protein
MQAGRGYRIFMVSLCPVRLCIGQSHVLLYRHKQKEQQLELQRIVIASCQLQQQLELQARCPSTL